MLTPKMMDKACGMFTTMVNKHSDELREAHFDFYVLELYDARYPDQLIQQAVPWCSLYWR